ncbi:MAG: small subunit ribosomal protein S4 [Candidatus Berkelbacteria bacterium Athens1014_28]|uniref:Small ribosomal subunit protein uS4 n=1 Tax=Candidatus Berkelbacteria bacterium Athens1014_28 TaxID=2017145 RepID=A0A554LR43_9BACT|nr:MAG: small subunit ribosomal protein S4 [Candidatus Berkelbacteria bacterium Athens1014_28]
MVAEGKKSAECNNKLMEKKCRKCRKEGIKLMLKGERCSSPKCAIVNRNYKPGQHGPGGFSKLSEYGKQLREKQKLKRIYGISETQLKNYYALANKKNGSTSENLIIFLETRLDSIIYGLGIGKSRRSARQIVNHKFLKQNGKNINIPSARVSQNDKITVSNVNFLKDISENSLNWVSFDKKTREIWIKKMPSIEDIDLPCDINLIIEYYSR